MTQDTPLRLRAHVDRLADDHPPLRLADADFTMRDPRALDRRFGRVLDYMARVELGVDRTITGPPRHP